MSAFRELALRRSAMIETWQTMKRLPLMISGPGDGSGLIPIPLTRCMAGDHSISTAGDAFHQPGRCHTMAVGVMPRRTFISGPRTEFAKAKGTSSARQGDPPDVSSHASASAGRRTCANSTRKAIEMTRQESFKRRIRARMATTGERYGAARRVLIDQSSARRSRSWAAQPEMSDEAVRTATGRGWDAWCDVLDAWQGDADNHGAIVEHLQSAHGVQGWWAQTVAVGYERITGRRMPFQRADGTFSASKQRTVSTDAATLRTMLLDDGERSELFPGWDTVLRSRPTSKNVRIAIGPGIAEIAMDPRVDGRVTVTIAHERLPSSDDVTAWKGYWTAWLEAIDDVTSGR